LLCVAFISLVLAHRGLRTGVASQVELLRMIVLIILFGDSVICMRRIIYYLRNIDGQLQYN
jgi:hypothetical protein